MKVQYWMGKFLKINTGRAPQRHEWKIKQYMFATLYVSKAFQCILCDLIWQNHRSHVKDLAACAQIHCISVNRLLNYKVRLVAKNAHLASRMETADM